MSKMNLFSRLEKYQSFEDFSKIDFFRFESCKLILLEFPVGGWQPTLTWFRNKRRKTKKKITFQDGLIFSLRDKFWFLILYCFKVAKHYSDRLLPKNRNQRNVCNQQRAIKKLQNILLLVGAKLLIFIIFLLLYFWRLDSNPKLKQLISVIGT